MPDDEFFIAKVKVEMDLLVPYNDPQTAALVTRTIIQSLQNYHGLIITEQSFELFRDDDTDKPDMS